MLRTRKLQCYCWPPETNPILHGPTLKKGRNVMDEIKEIEAEMSLKNISRNSVRTHLLTLNPHSNLFHRVPNLNYPVVFKRISVVWV